MQLKRKYDQSMLITQVIWNKEMHLTNQPKRREKDKLVLPVQEELFRNRNE